MKIKTLLQSGLPLTQSGESVKKQDSQGFLDALSEAIKKVGELENKANEMTIKHLTGQGVELHDVAIAAQKAELSVQLLNQIKNKVIRIYEELTRMQI